MKNSFKELIVVFRNQDLLRSDGFRPVGWYNGMFLWKKNATEEEESSTRVLKSEEVSKIVSRILPIDSLNAVIL